MTEQTRRLEAFLTRIERQSEKMLAPEQWTAEDVKEIDREIHEQQQSLLARARARSRDRKENR